MAKIVTEALFIQDATLKIAEDNYESAITSAKLTPSYPNPTVAIDGTQYPGKPKWNLELTYLQDLAPTSLTRYLFGNAGQEKECEFVPEDGGPTIEATIKIISGDLGGDADKNADAKVSLPLKGQPTITDPEPDPEP